MPESKLIPPSAPSGPPERNDRDFVKVVKVATGLSMGVMAAFLYSLKRVHPVIEMRFTVGTVLLFVLVGAFSWKFCGVLFDSEGQTAPDKKKLVFRWIVVFVTVTGLGTLASFGYALKDVSSESRREVIEGTLIAVGVLAMGGWLIFKAFQFFEEQSAVELEHQRQEQERRRLEEEDFDDQG